MVQYLCLVSLRDFNTLQKTQTSSFPTPLLEPHTVDIFQILDTHTQPSIDLLICFQMAKAFLDQILTIENSVKSGDSQDCIICREKCGTLSSETGIMELEVILPCGHTVGSAVSHPIHIH